MFLLVSLDDCGGQDQHPDLITINVSALCYSHLLSLRCWMEPKQDCPKALRHKDRFLLANIICRFNVSYWNRGNQYMTLVHVHAFFHVHSQSQLFSLIFFCLNPKLCIWKLLHIPFSYSPGISSSLLFLLPRSTCVAVYPGSIVILLGPLGPLLEVKSRW